MVNELTCPNCSTMMRVNQRYGVDIDFCPSYKGIWLDSGEIDKIANASKRYDEDHTYSNEHPGNYDDYPTEVRKYRNDDDYDHHRYESSQYGYKKKKRGFFTDFFDFS